jgi:hypothetical protein
LLAPFAGGSGRLVCLISEADRTGSIMPVPERSRRSMRHLPPPRSLRFQRAEPLFDGRHRHRACNESDVEPRFEEFTGPGSAYDYVISENLKRRDLTPAERIEVRRKLIDEMRVRAKERQAEAGRTTGKANASGKFTQSIADNVVPFTPTPAEQAQIRQRRPEDWKDVVFGKSGSHAIQQRRRVLPHRLGVLVDHPGGKGGRGRSGHRSGRPFLPAQLE